MAVLNNIGVEWVDPSALKDLIEGKSKSFAWVLILSEQSHWTEGNQHTIYATSINSEHYLREKSGKPFDKAESRKHPERYESVFSKEVAPYVTMILNGAFYQDNVPRIMTIADYVELKADLADRGLDKKRFLCVIDVSADWSGGLGE